tara:strand:+ start:9786 stop:10493 length:708 start_codon:yes stop_codon:yes gene_type:complete
MVSDYLTVICIYFTKFDIIKFNILNIKMLNSIKSNVNEAGIDEAGRGCLMGPVCTAAVILPDNFSTELYLEIRDSKKLSGKKREVLRKYIEDVAISWAVDFAYPSEIDKYNILNATLRSMHRVVEKLHVVPQHLAVDGNRFLTAHSFPPTDNEDEAISFTLIKGGDDKYRNIAAASILAKTNRDEYVNKLIEETPDFKKYGWETNMGYGTKKHMEGIRKYGITQYHRLSFKPCQI